MFETPQPETPQPESPEAPPEPGGGDGESETGE